MCARVCVFFFVCVCFFFGGGPLRSGLSKGKIANIDGASGFRSSVGLFLDFCRWRS